MGEFDCMILEDAYDSLKVLMFNTTSKTLASEAEDLVKVLKDTMYHEYVELEPEECKTFKKECKQALLCVVYNYNDGGDHNITRELYEKIQAFLKKI